MIVRFGYVAMSVVVPNCSPSKTMTATTFQKITDREAAIRKLQRIAAENLQNTLRLLKHNQAHDIHVYRFSSKLIPLISHEWLSGWDPFPILEPFFREIGDYVKAHGMRVSFHPDHFTVLSTPRPEILKASIRDLHIHVKMLDTMGLGEEAKCNIHIGGAYGDKPKSLERFIRQFSELDESIRRRITLENDDKTFNALETLKACEALQVPMVLDIHHQWVNNEGERAIDLWPRVLQTWADNPQLPPKIHVSSPKSESDPRGHADDVDAGFVRDFLISISKHTDRLDVMIEAKRKDGALFQLMEDLPKLDSRIKKRDQATIELE
ncbi:UV DNA damage repair endonuclease UvsE [Marinicrinis lubricantis]|uniref:UV DNA damage repair endonuclease UvsE n=1 Tax=Marinicrinis lubricantis TaxID=2086470 RepID=A0ABW1IJ81_9BACL